MLTVDFVEVIIHMERDFGSLAKGIGFPICHKFLRQPYGHLFGEDLPKFCFLDECSHELAGTHLEISVALHIYVTDALLVIVKA